MNTSANAKKLYSVADDGIEYVRYCAEQASWLQALARAIDDALDGGKANVHARASHARALAGLANYLANDLHSWSLTRAKDLQSALDDAEGEAQ